MSFLKPTPATSNQSSNSSSSNVNNGLITKNLSPAIQDGVSAIGDLSNAIGGAGGYQNYLQNAGYQPAMTAMTRGVVGQGAASGLLNSGATAQALQTRGTQLNQSFYNNYLQQLTGLSGLGLQAGGLVANAGQQSTSSSTGSNNGGGPSTAGTIAGLAGSVAGIFSDRRLKTAIRKVGEFADGLGIYTFRYIGQPNRVRGVMADEVERLRPWALGRRVAGYATVNYGAL